MLKMWKIRTLNVQQWVKSVQSAEEGIVWMKFCPVCQGEERKGTMQRQKESNQLTMVPAEDEEQAVNYSYAFGVTITIAVVSRHELIPTPVRGVEVITDFLLLMWARIERHFITEVVEVSLAFSAHFVTVTTFKDLMSMTHLLHTLTLLTLLRVDHSLSS
jgi:hypothetical protein